MTSADRNPMRIRPLWWLAQAGLILVAALFLLFGVQLLVAAYDLPDPFTFIMTFFAACLIILISIALLVGFMWRLWSVYRHLKSPPVPVTASASPPLSGSPLKEPSREGPSREGPSQDDETLLESQKR
jgi:hypothetical protein